jgi:hypothetical protein
MKSKALQRGGEEGNAYATHPATQTDRDKQEGPRGKEQTIYEGMKRRRH